MLNAVIRRYQSYNPATGAFDQPRGVREYSRLLDMNSGQLSQILNDIQQPGVTVIRRFLQTFPGAADEIAVALSAPERETAEVA